MKALITMALLGASLAFAQDPRGDQHQNGSHSGGHGRPFRFPGLLFFAKNSSCYYKMDFFGKVALLSLAAAAMAKNSS